MSITIISGANAEYSKFYQKIKEDALRFGYNFQGYDYGGLKDGIPISVELHNPKDFSKYVGKIPDKPFVVLDALERHKTWIIYLDADVRIRDSFNEIIGDYDIGITAHDPKFHQGTPIDTRYNFITGYLNAGVIFFNNTEGTRKFIVEWIKKIKASTANSDQEGLTSLLKEYIPEMDWDKEYHNVAGAKIRLFPAAKYNYISRYGYDPAEAKLIHYTGTTEEKINQGALK